MLVKKLESGGDSPAEWVDLDLEQADDLGWLRGQSGMDPAVVELIENGSAGVMHHEFEQGTYVSLVLARLGQAIREDRSVKVGLWIERERIVSLHWGPPGEIYLELRKAVEAGHGPATPWAVFAYVATRIPAQMQMNLAQLAKTVDAIEEVLLEAGEALPIDQLAILRQRLIFMRRHRAPFASVVHAVAGGRNVALDEESLADIGRAEDSMRQQQELLDSYIDRATVIQEQIESQLNNRMNSSMYRLTLVATVFLPLTFVTGLLGINVAGIPGNHDPYAFWLVCGALILVAVVSISIVAVIMRR